ncbi:MAG: MerR family transcriptional regulator [Methanobacteriota archaeon]|nr:MAG: MerR family transcriptional regulator [Euryarchaeota archaeon]
MTIQKPLEKLYYSLRQVEQMLGVEKHIIKGWEKDFPQLKPVRNRAGNRYYSEKELELLFLIKEWLMDRDFSPEEVREKIVNRRDDSQDEKMIQLKRILAEVKLELQEIQELLNE